MSESIVKLIDDAKRGDVSAFMKLVRRVEEICRRAIVNNRQVWLGKDLVLVNYCTYMLIDKQEKAAYVLLRCREYYTVMRLDISPMLNLSEREIAEALCVYVDDIESAARVV
ncbi:MAG: hypothetical protein GXO10_03125 [Crenarchaeota archaeon]|nr:hypothetical protein [Thermoproteota archaeon]